MQNNHKMSKLQIKPINWEQFICTFYKCKPALVCKRCTVCVITSYTLPQILLMFRVFTSNSMRDLADPDMTGWLSQQVFIVDQL